MRKKLIIGALGVFVVGLAGASLWVRSVLTQDSVRAALAEQISKQLGHPVTVGSISAGIYPRVTVTLGEVVIGNPARIQVHSLAVGTDFRALLSRRIEHASLRLNGARIELPLPSFATLTQPAPAEPSAGSSPVQLVSVDEIILSGVEVVSGGRTLRGDIDVVPEGQGLKVRKIALNADDTSVNLTGQITDLAGPAGELTLTAGTLNVDHLLAFVTDFTTDLDNLEHTESQPDSANPRNPVNPVNPVNHVDLVLSIAADRATLGAMAIDKLSGRVRITAREVSLEPLAFNLFGGRYEGTMAVALGGTVPEFRWKASVSNLDVAAATAFAGSPDTVSGRLTARIDLSGRGADATTAMKTVTGSARIDVTDGVVKNLGLIRTVVAATSLNAGAVQRAATGSRDEAFSRLGGTLAIGNGSATTNDLRFESADLTLTAAGSAQLDGHAMHFKGQVQLSEELSKQTGGSSVMRVAHDNGRLTLPATISGSAENPQVRIDSGDMAKRAVKNAAKEQGQKAVQSGLKGLFGR